MASGWELETSDTAPRRCAKIETSARLQGLQPRLCHGEPTVTRSSHQSPATIRYFRPESRPPILQLLELLQLLSS